MKDLSGYPKDHNRNLNEAATITKAHKKLFRKQSERIFKTANDAEDVFQETTLKVLERFHTGKPVKHPKVWMVRIAKDECVNFYRQMKIDANKDTDLAAFSKRGFKSDLTALVFYCIIRDKKKPTRYTKWARAFNCPFFD